MSSHSLSGNALNTALVALVGVAAAAVVKLLLDEAPATARNSRTPATRADPERRALLRRAKLAELAIAAHDPMYLADMQEVSDNFAFVDAGNI